MRRVNGALAAVLALSVLLSGCVGNPGQPDSTGGSFGTVEALRDAYIRAGGECPEWQRNDRIRLAQEDGDCDGRTVLSIYADDSDLTQAVRNLKSHSLGSTGYHVLVGQNWIINTPAAAAIQEQLGGVLHESDGEPEVAPEPEPEPEPPLPTFTKKGKGDAIVKVEIDRLALFSFSCPKCTRNVVVRSDGGESLLVNTIGKYSGSHWINLDDNSLTTRFTIKAKGSWTLTIQDPAEAVRYDGVATGSGDSAFLISAAAEIAAIEHRGQRNFIVHAYGNGEWRSLVVNEIGSYRGTVELKTPALIQVRSSGKWSITPEP